MLMEAGPKNITVQRDGDTCTVAPRVLIAYPGDEITFKNQTDGQMLILMSHENVFPECLFDVAQKQDSLPMTVQGVPPGAYPYAVFCREVDNFARASSMPIIIIVPR